MWGDEVNYEKVTYVELSKHLPWYARHLYIRQERKKNLYILQTNGVRTKKM
eukprot:UN19066